MDDFTAEMIVETWTSGAGIVARGPKMLVSVVPATPGEVERHTGRHHGYGADLWRLEVGGRFVASSGHVYPSGVPYPEELHSQTAVIAQEVWLYADADGDVIGAYWWPDALRRPIASKPQADHRDEITMHPSDAHRAVDFPVPIPQLQPWEAVIAACPSRREVIVFCTSGSLPEPLNDMLVYEKGGMTIRARRDDEALNVEAFLRKRQPPYRRMQVGGKPAVGREPGRALGPQTWPWPGELRWWDEGVSYEAKGFIPLSTLVDIASSLP